MSVQSMAQVMIAYLQPKQNKNYISDAEGSFALFRRNKYYNVQDLRKIINTSLKT